MNGAQLSRATIHRYARLLQSCTKAKDLIHGMLLHSPLHELGIDSGLFLGNTLIYMYAKCGCLQHARYVFDKLSESNVFSWTAIISAYSDHGKAGEAISMYQRMCESDLTLDKYVFLSVLKACISLRSLTVGMVVHMHVIFSGLFSDVFVANTIVDMYAKCSCLSSAQQVFCLLHKQDIISWNSVMTGCLHHGLHEETSAYYLQMQMVGMQPNSVTCMLALKACACCGSLINAKRIHVEVLEGCCKPDLALYNTLVDMYAKGGDIELARISFDKMPQKDAVSWNVMIAGCVEEGLVSEVFFLFVSMIQEGFKPDQVTFSTILKACAHLTTAEYGRYVHFLLMIIGSELDNSAICALIGMYMKCGSQTDAWYLFGNVPVKDLITWNLMIMGCAQNGTPEESFNLFEQFLTEGSLPDKMTTISLLKACLSFPVPDQSKANLVLATQVGFLSDILLSNAVLQVFVDCGRLGDAYQTLFEMRTRDVASWNIVLVASIQQGCGENALLLFGLMLQESVMPDHITFSSVLKVCATLPVLEWGMEIHRLVNVTACESSISVDSALVDMYAKSGSLDDAFKVFDSMEEQQLVAWTAMISGFALQGLWKDSFRLFAKMLDEGIKPDAVTCVAVLSLCSRAGLLQEGFYIFSLMNNTCCNTIITEHAACMVDLLARAGHLQGAKNLLLSMPIPLDAVVWMVLLDACRIHGDVEMGRSACKCTLSLDPQCAQAYVVLSNIYALAGMWDEVSKIREEMKNVVL